MSELALVLAFELCIATTTASEPIEMLGHIGALLTPRALSLVNRHIAVLVNLVLFVSLSHLLGLRLLVFIPLQHVISFDALHLIDVGVDSCRALCDANPKTSFHLIDNDR